MEQNGHSVLVTARNKEITLDLLSKYHIDFIPVGKQKHGKFALLKEWAVRDYQILNIARKFNPDIMLGIGNPSVAHAARMLDKHSVIFTDTEHARLANDITFPFASTICTPSCFKHNIGPKQVYYKGYHELAYLHPNRYAPDPSTLDELNLTKDDRFIVLRFVSWQASHDMGHHGIHDKTKLVKALEQYGQVLITSEGALPPDLQPYQVRVSPEKLHDVLYYATIYIGEGGTMASEAAALGTPSIFISTLVGTMGNFIELEKTYDLLYSFTDEVAALDKGIEILNDLEIKRKWRLKQERLISDKIDVTAFMVWFIENYPNSITKMREHPETQKQFYATIRKDHEHPIVQQ